MGQAASSIPCTEKRITQPFSNSLGVSLSLLHRILCLWGSRCRALKTYSRGSRQLLVSSPTTIIEERVAMRIAVQSTSVGSNNGDDISYLTERLS